MAVKFVSEKKASVELVEGFTHASGFDPVQVDKYVEFKKEHDALAKSLKKLKEHVDDIAGEMVEFANVHIEPTETMMLQGNEHVVEVSKRRNEVSEVNVDKVLELLGAEMFLKIAKVGITDLRKYLTPDQFAEVAKEGPTGSRTIKVVD